MQLVTWTKDQVLHLTTMDKVCMSPERAFIYRRPAFSAWCRSQPLRPILFRT